VVAIFVFVNAGGKQNSAATSFSVRELRMANPESYRKARVLVSWPPRISRARLAAGFV